MLVLLYCTFFLIQFLKKKKEKKVAEQKPLPCVLLSFTSESRIPPKSSPDQTVPNQKPIRTPSTMQSCACSLRDIIVSCNAVPCNALLCSALLNHARNFQKMQASQTPNPSKPFALAIRNLCFPLLSFPLKSFQHAHLSSSLS